MKIKLPLDTGYREASPDKVCFYCDTKIKGEHGEDCVIPQKTVVVRMVTQYVVSVPANWDKQQIEFQRNEGSWCTANDIERLIEIDHCWCRNTTYEVLRNATAKDHDYLPVMMDDDKLELEEEEDSLALALS